MNNISFQKSITKELDIVKNRVRSLLGSKHWGEEGRYKEAILKTVINRFLPSNLSIGTGFIVSEVALDSTISNQLDLIVYDNTIPVLFKEGDFIITTEKNVKGIIEVKSKINATNLKKAIDDFNNLFSSGIISNNQDKKIFKGLFAYENGIANIESNITFSSLLKKANGNINHITIGKNYFIRFWQDGRNLDPPVETNNSFYNLYRIEDLSFSYFISNLLHMSSNQALDDRYQFSFPIAGTKEVGRKRVIAMEDE